MAVRTVSTKLAIEGESEYRKAIQNINTELTNLNSKLGVVKSEFQNNQNSMEALSAKSEVLADKQKTLGDKVEVCKKQLENAKSAVDLYKDKISDTESKLKTNADAQSKLSDEVKDAGTQFNTYRDRVSDAEEKLKNLENSTGDTSEEEKRLNDVIDDSKEAMQKLNDSTGGMAEKAADLQVEESKLNEDLADNENHLAGAEAECQKYETDMNRAQTQLNNTNAEIELNDKYLEEAANSADGCATSIDQFGKKTDTAGEGVKNMSNNLDIMTLQMAQRELQKLFEGLCDAMMACVDAAAEFEQQMSTVEAISGATGEEMNKLTDIAKEMGSTTTYTATESGEALEYMALAGWKTDDMLDALPDVLNLAAASGSDLATTSDIVTDALTAFGYEAKDASHFSDVLAASSSNSNTTVEQLGSAFQKVGPLAGTMGYSVEDVSEALGLMADSGIKAESAGTALNTMLTRMSGTNSSARNELEKLNVEMYNADGTARPLGDVIDDLRGAFSNLSESEQTEAAYNLAGQRGMSAMLSIVQASDDDYDKLADSIDDCNGAAKDMAETKLDNYAGQVTLLESAWDGLKVEIGEQLTPALGDIVEILTNVVNWITNFIKQNPEVVAIITGLATAIGIAAGAVAAIVAALKLWELAQKAVNAAMDANPIMLIVTACAALTAGIIAFVGVLEKNYNPGVEESKKRTKELKEAMDDLEDSVEETSEQIKENANTTDFLKNAIVDLMGKEQLSATEKQKMADYVSQLNELYPSLGLSIDETTGSLDMETDAFEDLIDAAECSSEITAIAQDQEKAEQDAATATDNLAEAQRQKDLVTAAMNGDEDAYNELLDEELIKVGLLNPKQTALTRLYQQLDKEIQTDSDDLDYFNGVLEDSKEATAELEKELSGLSDAEYDSYTKVGAITEQLCGDLLDLQKSYEEARQSAKESAEEQFDLFETVEEEAKKSAKDIMESLESQEKYWKEYSSNLANLQSRNIDGLDELIAKFDDGTTEGAAMVASFADMTDEEIEKIVEEYGLVEDEEDNWAKQHADLITGFNEQTQEVIDGLIDWIDQQEGLTEADKEFMLGMVEDYVDDVSELDEDYEGELSHIYSDTQEEISNALGLVEDGVSSLDDELKKQEKEFKNYSNKMGDAVKSIDELRDNLKDLKDKYNEVRDASIESAETQFGMFDKVEQAAVTSFEDIMGALESQAEYWNNYGDNIDNVLSRNIEGIDEWVASWNDGSDDAVAAAASFAELSDEQLQQVVDYMTNDLAGSWEYAGEEIAESQTNLTEKTAEFTEQEKVYIDDMMNSLDMSEEGKNMAWGFINEYIDGLAEGEEPMTEEYESIIEGVQYFCEERLATTNQFTDDFLMGLYTKMYEADLTPEAEQIIWDAVDAANTAMVDADEPTQNQIQENISHIAETITSANLGPGAEQAIWEAINAAQGALDEGEALTIQQIDDIISVTVGEYDEFRKRNKWFTEDWINDIGETMTGLDFSEDASTDAWNLIMAYADTLPQGVKPSEEAVNEIIGVVQSTLDMDDEAREEAIDDINSFFEGLQEGGSNNIDDMEGMMSLIAELFDLDDETREKAESALRCYANGMTDSSHFSFEEAENIINGVVKRMEDGDYDDAGEEAGSEYSEGIEETLDDAKSAGEDSGDAYIEGLNSKSDDYKEAGKNAGEGYAEGVKNSKGEVENASKEVAQASVDTWNKTLDEHSPSKITETSGKNFIAGYVNGVNSEENDMTKTLSSLANSGITTWNNSATHTVLFTSGVNTLKGYKDGLDSSKETVYTKLENIASQSIKSFNNAMSDSSLRNTGKNVINGFINGLNDNSSNLYKSMQNLAKNALNSFNNTLGVHSPSTEGEWSAEMTAQGWIIGIEKSTGDVEDSMKTLADEAMDAFDVSLNSDMADLASLDNLSATYNLGNAELNNDTTIYITMPIYAGKNYTKTEIVEIALDGINHKQINQYASRGVTL